MLHCWGALAEHPARGGGWCLSFAQGGKASGQEVGVRRLLCLSLPLLGPGQPLEVCVQPGYLLLTLISAQLTPSPSPLEEEGLVRFWSQFR